MRSIKVGEMTYLAVDAASASELLALESDEFWAGLTRGELDELDDLAGELGTLPDWWFEILLNPPAVPFDAIRVKGAPLRSVTSVKPQGNLVRPPGSVAGPIYPSAKTYIRGARGSNEEKP